MRETLKISWMSQTESGPELFETRVVANRLRFEPDVAAQMNIDVPRRGRFSGKDRLEVQVHFRAVATGIRAMEVPDLVDMIIEHVQSRITSSYISCQASCSPLCQP